MRGGLGNLSYKDSYGNIFNMRMNMLTEAVMPRASAKALNSADVGRTRPVQTVIASQLQRNSTEPI